MIWLEIGWNGWERSNTREKRERQKISERSRGEKTGEKIAVQDERIADWIMEPQQTPPKMEETKRNHIRCGEKYVILGFPFCMHSTFKVCHLLCSAALFIFAVLFLLSRASVCVCVYENCIFSSHPAGSLCLCVHVFFVLLRGVLYIGISLSTRIPSDSGDAHIFESHAYLAIFKCWSSSTFRPKVNGELDCVLCDLIRLHSSSLTPFGSKFNEYWIETMNVFIKAFSCISHFLFMQLNFGYCFFQTVALNMMIAV